MMRRACIAIAAIGLMSLSANAECNIALANELNTTPLPEIASEEFDSKITERTDGALWSIYKNKSGAIERIVHTDYGESGRDIHRLTISDNENYIITVHHIYYLAPREFEGSSTHREVLDHYPFCEAQLDLPPEWDEYDKAYPVDARKAADFFFTSEEIKQQLKSAGITPPTWK